MGLWTSGSRAKRLPGRTKKETETNTESDHPSGPIAATAGRLRTERSRFCISIRTFCNVLYAKLKPFKNRKSKESLRLLLYYRANQKLDYSFPFQLLSRCVGLGISE